jgi:hypothetical protein
VTKRDVPAEDVFIAELAVDTDYDYYLAYRNEPDPVAAIEASVEQIINAVNIQYERDVGIRHIITAVIVRPTIDDPYSGLDPEAMLTQVRNHWATEQSHIHRDLVQLFTARNFSGSTIGIAWIGQVCASYGYSIIQTSCCGSFACRTDLSAHELGHNWGAHHCGYEGPSDPDDCVPECLTWTMNCELTCSNRFHATLTQPEIISHRNSRTCLVEGDELRRVDVVSTVDAVIEGGSLPMSAIADFRYSNDENVTPDAVWFVNRPAAGSVDESGMLTAAEVDGNTCIVVSASYTYGGVTRTGDRTILVLDTDSTLAIVDSDPPDGAIDARQPSAPDGTDLTGWEFVDITFNGDACLMDPEDFEVETQSRASNWTSIPAEVEHIGLRAVRVVFANPVEGEAWTTVTHVDSDEAVRLGSLPADVNGDSRTDADDIRELIRHLQGQSDPPLAIWQADIDRSGRCTPADLLRVIDLYNGADAYLPFAGLSLP